MATLTKKLFLIITVTIAGFGVKSVLFSNPARHATYQSDCPFCRTIAGQEGAILWQEADVVVIAKNRPVRPPLCVDCLIIPRKHIRSREKLDMNDQYDQTILSKMDRVAQKLGTKLSGNGEFTTHINNEANQGVYHMHMHFKSCENWCVDPSLWENV